MASVHLTNARARRGVRLAGSLLLATGLALGCRTGSSGDQARRGEGTSSPDQASARTDGEGGARRRAPDAADREAFRAWFVLLADAQFSRPTPDVIDCAALIRHAAREALRPHTPEWLRRMHLPITRVYPEVVHRPAARDGMLPIFQLADDAGVRHAEFADAQTIIRDNADHVGRHVSALRPGDLLAFHQPEQDEPYHLMVFIGRSVFEAEGDDWIVYHTGPLGPGPDEDRPDTRVDERASDDGIGDVRAGDVRAGDVQAGEVRKVRLQDLMRHPAPRWRPAAFNSRFLGLYRLQLP